ncbi:energy transducer TonB [Sulfurospirillum halorespirans]|uniref:TonB-like protein n=1 Tax=Sulfurospirillum halorespirans DSM 13726 TaxID=1193502 RepID=A0A1D7TN97_9BACT|nr:energy transducer TonB [Sulfurospirillum halorespirans]AOO66394.1 TonB-like protein [Sulfurospirillum halorespirans DSM 13726]
MRRLSFALLLSLGLHLALLLFLTIFTFEKPKTFAQSAPVSLRISTVISQSEAPKHEVSPQEETLPPHESASLKKLPQKEKPIKPVSHHMASTVLENNASSPVADASPLPPTTPQISASSIETPTYLDLHKNEIAQALQRAKSYPELARRRSIEGVVEVSFTIKPTGEVEEVEATSQSQLLSSAAIESVHKAKGYFPIPLENVTIKVPIVYRLK